MFFFSTRKATLEGVLELGWGCVWGLRPANILFFGHCSFQIQLCYGHKPGPVLLLSHWWSCEWVVVRGWCKAMLHLYSRHSSRQRVGEGGRDNNSNNYTALFLKCFKVKGTNMLMVSLEQKGWRPVLLSSTFDSQPTDYQNYSNNMPPVRCKLREKWTFSCVLKKKRKTAPKCPYSVAVAVAG